MRSRDDVGDEEDEDGGEEKVRTETRCVNGRVDGEWNSRPSHQSSFTMNL